MKQLIILAGLLLIVGVTISAAQSNQNTNTFQTDYLKKSKNQKKAAYILLGGGGALMITGIIIPKGDITHIDPAGGTSYKNDGIKSVFTQSGALAMLGSIPFFIVSGKNKKKAMSLSFKNEAVPQIFKQSIVSLSLPSLALKLGL